MDWTAEKIRDLFISIVKSASREVKKLGDSGDKKVAGDSRINFATEADITVAKLVREKLKKAKFPTVLHSEDGQPIDYSGGKPQFYTSCDELDGTENARRGRGLRPFVTMLCSFDNPKPTFNDALVAVLYAHHTGHTLYAIRGKGCYFQEPGKIFEKVKTSGAIILEKSIAGRIDTYGSKEKSAEIVKALQEHSWLKDFGSSGFHFFDIAIGGNDFFVNARGKGEEAGPGYLIVSEAGGAMIDSEGRDYGPHPFAQDQRYKMIAAATEKLAQAVLKKLQKQF